MKPIRGIWYTLVWLQAWFRFSLHYMLVWELPGFGMGLFMKDEEIKEIIGRMADGPMRFEYQRIQALKDRARMAFYRHPTFH